MKFRLVEEQIEYNANPQDRNENDCSIRALSLAYGLNYNQVKNELKHLGYEDKTQFNELNVIKKFIDKHGYKKFINNERDAENNIGSVESFAKKYHNGVYIVYCSNNIKQNTSNSFHLVTVANGNIYDTWDSSNYYVIGAWEVPTNINKINKSVEEK